MTIQVSVVVPVRNAEAYLDACIKSVLAQSLRDFELLLLDDGSTDRSAELALAWARRDARVHLHRVQGDGIVAALNQGLALARGEYIARMDGDDMMREHRLRKQLDTMLNQPTLAVLASRVQGFSAEPLKAGYRFYLDWQNSVVTHEQICQEIFVESPLAHPSVMFRKQCVLDAGGYKQGPFPEDYELWLRLMRRGVRFYKLPDVLLDWRDSDTRASRIDARYSRAAFDRLRAQYLSQDERLQEGRPLAFWGAGRRTRQRIQCLLDMGFRASVWIDIDPRKIGNRVADAWVRAPAYLASRRHQVKPFVLVYVNNHGAKRLIARELHTIGYLPGADYVMVG